MTPALNLLADHFYLTKLHLVVQLQKDAKLPAFKGAMWHGLVGHALKAHSESLYHLFYAEHDTQQPKPYAIVASQDHKTYWRKNEHISVEITLFGDACQKASDVVAAFTAASNNKSLGVGEQKVPFRLLSVSSMTPQGLKAGIYAHCLQDWLPVVTELQPEQELALNFLTPVRIKHNGKQLRAFPKALNVDFFAKQILRRLVQLSRFWVVDREDLFSDIYAETLLPSQCEITTHCYFEDWIRYSALQQREIPLSGIKGQISFYGAIGHLAPLFKIGELLHIGGKTTFGLGKYQLIS